MSFKHQFVDRQTGSIRDELLFGDRYVRWLYQPMREHMPLLFRALTGRHASALLGYFHYDSRLSGQVRADGGFLARCGVNLAECYDQPETLDTARKVFERKIRYWDCRPLPQEVEGVVSPADARVLIGSMREAKTLFVKEKFFSFEELLGPDKLLWQQAFQGGDFAVFRLTPDKYHYNHVPVTGQVVDFYVIDGAYHACNPSATVELVTPLSKNKRVVTVIDTDVEGGSGVGMVAMIEVVALMIGEVVQCYSRLFYDDPQPIAPGMHVQRGCPKSLYRPGSSTDVLLFEPGRIAFSDDLVANSRRRDVASRFSSGFGHPLVETEVELRSRIALRA